MAKSRPPNLYERPAPGPRAWNRSRATADDGLPWTGVVGVLVENYELIDASACGVRRASAALFDASSESQKRKEDVQSSRTEPADRRTPLTHQAIRFPRGVENRPYCRARFSTSGVACLPCLGTPNRCGGGAEKDLFSAVDPRLAGYARRPLPAGEVAGCVRMPRRCMPTLPLASACGYYCRKCHHLPDSIP